MKAKQLFSILVMLVFLSITNTLNSQNLFESETDFQGFIPQSKTIDLRTYEVDIESYEINYDASNALERVIENEADPLTFALKMIAISAGLGFSENETLWCLGAAYYLRLAMFTNSALYGSLGAGYSGASGDNFTLALFDFNLKVLMFTALTKRYNQVQFIYGLLGGYTFGNENFNDGFKTNITRITAAFVVGFYILMTEQLSIMLQTNLLTYQSQTREYDGNEIKDNTTFGLINKDNLLTFSLVWTLFNSRR